MFGGNSNWRGPVWLPINFLFVQALDSYARFLGDEFRVPDPADRTERLTLAEVGDRMARSLTGLLVRDPDGRRAVFGNNNYFQTDPTGGIWCPSTSTSMAIPDEASARVIRPDGPPQSLCCCSSAAGWASVVASTRERANRRGSDRGYLLSEDRSHQREGSAMMSLSARFGVGVAGAALVLAAGISHASPAPLAPGTPGTTPRPPAPMRRSHRRIRWIAPIRTTPSTARRHRLTLRW